MAEIARGISSNVMRVATCKDCGREIEGLRRKLAAARADGQDREITALEKDLERKERSAGQFSYSEHSATGILDRGGSRSDRCPEHRRKHRTNTQGMAVAYVDLQTIGEALGAHEPEGPTGPFGGLGPLPARHEKEQRAARLAEYEFGMTDVDIVGILELLRDDRHRVLVLRAGTGTGKSTFGPYRLMDPPTKADLEELGLMDKVTNELAQFGLPPLDGDPYRLTDLGPIVVTEPRVAAATGVSQFVGEKLAIGCKLKQCDNPAHGLLLFNPKAHIGDPGALTGPSCPDFGRKENDRPMCTREHVGEHPATPKRTKACVITDCGQHIGPGFPVGYQAKGVRHWDDSCQLVFATDGAVINWLRDGRLNRIGTVIVDEAHERSTNIDFIMGYLKRDLARYPHLRVIITSATFEPKFYEEYFGEFHPGVVAVKDVPSVKTVGYGLPLFPDLDLSTNEMREFLGRAADDGKPANQWPEADRWPLVDVDSDVLTQLTKAADKVGLPTEAQKQIDRILSTHWATKYAPTLNEHEVKDPREAKGGENEYIEDLWETTRKLIPLRLELDRVIKDTKDWRERMPDLVAEFVIRLEAGLREAKIFGDILAFLPTEKKINEAVEKIKAAVGAEVDVLPLISKLPEAKVDEALAARRKGDPRKIVVSTNLAETSLTVEGVRFVVDSGLIAQSDWKPELAAGGVGTTLHSQSGIKQRWGRVGRKAPGWVFPLYSKRQFSGLPADTPPGSARENLEQLMMTARLGGIDDVLNFPWPAAFEPKSVTLDSAAQEATKTFVRESHRADAALRSSGAVTRQGYPTAMGKELTKFSELGSSAAAMAVLYADRLGCVPEVVTILKLLDDQRLVGSDSLFLDDRDWPDEWRVEAYNRHRGLMSLAEDDAHLALVVCAAWEQADPTAESPWADSQLRRAWCRQWWVNNDVLVNAAVERQKVLALLSPKMKKAVTRSVQPALLDRARGVLARTMRATEFRLDGHTYVPLDIPPRLKPDGTADMEPTRFTVEPDSVMKERPERILALRRRENKNAESFISGLIKLPAERSKHAESSAADAMAMVVEFKERAPVDKLRDVALTLLKDWPIGQRVRLTAADQALAAQQLKLTVQVDPPFAKPLLTEAEFAAEGQRPPRGGRSAKRRRGDDDLDYDANSSDGAGDFAKRRVRGSDEEKTAERAFEHGEQEIGSADRAAAEGTCGWCKLCREGKPQFCLEIKRQRKLVVDALKEHREELDGLRARSLQALTLEFEGEEQPRLFEVTEYKNGASTHPVVVLVPDWRAEGADPDPSKHQGVHAGKHIEVVVGDAVQDHAGELLTFVRADGGGRFLLREANASLKKQEERGTIAPSLSAGTSGLLAILAQSTGQRFTATVVPGRVRGAYTITTLQMLNQHWQLGMRGAAVSHVEDEGSRTQRTPYYHAVVHEAPNPEGYLTFRLLHQDSRRGLVHLISHGSVEPEDPRWKEGTAHKLALVPDTTPRLDASGVDLEGLRKITGDRANGLHFGKAKSGGSDAGNSREPNEEDVEGSGARLAYSTETGGDGRRKEAVVLAPPGTSVGIKSEYGKPISSKVAEALAALDAEADDWANRVWSFWARSFHIRLDRNKEILPGDSTTAEEVAFEGVVLDEEPPGVVADREFEAYAKSNLEGRHVKGTITRVDEYSAFVDIGEPFEGRLHVSNIAHTHVDRADGVFHRGDEIMAVVLQNDADYRRVELSVKALLTSPFDEYRARHKIGDKVHVTVTHATGTHVYLTHSNGAAGVIYFRNLGGPEITDASNVVNAGDEIDAEIVDFNDEKAQIELSVKALLYRKYKDRHSVGDRVEAIVGRVSKTHVNVRHSNGAAGVIHVRQLEAGVEDASVHYLSGTRIAARIAKFDDGKKQIELTVRGLLFDEYKARHKQGDEVRAVVTRVTVTHVYLKHLNGAEGVIYHTNWAWESFTDLPSVAIVGTEVLAKITRFNDDRQQIELSRKQSLPRPYPGYRQNHSIGQPATGIVTNTIPSAAFVDLGGGVEGRIHVGQLAAIHVNHPDDVVRKGQTVTATIIDFNDAKQQVELSLKAVPTATRPATPVRPAKVPPPQPRPSISTPRTAPRTAEAQGDSVQTATAAACSKLGVDTSAVHVQVIDPGQPKRFLRAAKPALVRVTTK